MCLICLLLHIGNIRHSWHKKGSMNGKGVGNLRPGVETLNLAFFFFSDCSHLRVVADFNPIQTRGRGGAKRPPPQTFS